MNITALVLTAGKSSRMGKDKLSLPLYSAQDTHRSEPIMTIGGKVLSTVLTTEQIQQVVTVTAPYSSPEWQQEIQQWTDRYPAKMLSVVCEQAHLGMSYSIRCGMKQVRLSQADAVLILLGDQPLITSTMLTELITIYLHQPDIDYIASADQEGIKPPIIFPAHMWTHLEQLQGDQGARKVVMNPDFYSNIVKYPAHFFWDADTPEALAQIQYYLHSST
ncbi:nucleotidyltransferase family protein [Paenibacillus nicotianae]|uniref:Nucleotidyltransferase family protein n=1 Tax=Paenibacillus nicotianae TaxID=1526551 RepID=A0ABW4UWR1_9BACL